MRCVSILEGAQIFIVKEEDGVSIHAIQLFSLSFRNNFSILSCVA